MVINIMARTKQVTKKASSSSAEDYSAYVKELQTKKPVRAEPKKRDTIEDKISYASHTSIDAVNDNRSNFYKTVRPNMKRSILSDMSDIDVPIIIPRDMIRPSRRDETSPLSSSSSSPSPPVSSLDKAPWLSLESIASDDDDETC